jgi:hypothetical protein
MKAVHYRWQGADCTWYASWMGNGLGVSALLVLAITVLWVLGGLDRAQQPALLPVAWAAFVSLALVGVIGFRYFTPFIGIAFSLVALLAGVAAAGWTVAR